MAIRTAAATLALLDCCVLVHSLLSEADAAVKGKKRLKPKCLQYNYLEDKDLLVCACDKCGSTSLYSYLYEVEFGKKWNYTGHPFEQDLYSFRWKDKWTEIKKAQAREVKHRFALIRDPKERLVAAWKSKLACDEMGFGTDDNDRKRIVPMLYQLAGQPAEYCMGFEKFVELLYIVHNNRKAHKLDCHIRPQQIGCFRDMSPSQWTHVGTVGNTSLQSALAQAVEAPPDIRVHHLHRSRPYQLRLSNRTLEMLDNITRLEYKAFAGHW